MKRLRGLLVGLAIIVLQPIVAAQQRPVVGVSFDLAVPRWQAHLGDDRPIFEKQAAAHVAKFLGDQVGFVSFDPDVPSTPKLIVHLEVAPGAGVSLKKATQLRLELAGAAPAASLAWSFRPEGTFAEPTGGLLGLLKELDLRLVDVNRPELVGEVLSRVSIAKVAHLWKNPVVWVIPYRKTELCMELSSVLRIVSMMPSPAGPQQRIYRTRAKGEFRPEGSTESPDWIGRLFTVPEKSAAPEETEAGLDALGAADPQKVSIQAIYVLDYQRMQPCVESVSPATVDFRGGTR